MMGNSFEQSTATSAWLKPLAAIIYRERKRQSLSQGEVAQRVKIAAKAEQRQSGANRITIHRWETGIVTPQPDSVRWLAVALSLTLDDLVEAADLQRQHEIQPSSQRALVAIPDGVTGEEAYLMIRRQFLQHLFAMAGLTLMQSIRTIGPSPKQVSTDIDEFMNQCRGNIDSCWRLLKGPDIMVVPSVLIVWLPLLDVAVQRPSPQRTQLAKLAAEGWLIAGLVAVLQDRHDRAEWCCKQAHDYAVVAQDLNLQVAALKHLATKYQSAGLPLLHLRTYEQALPMALDASPLLQSRTYLGLALAHAECGNDRDAARNLMRAEDTFPDRPQDDPSFGYADCGRSSLHHYGGLIRMRSGQPREAWETFAATMTDDQIAVVPQRTVIEINNCQAEAAIEDGDLDLAYYHVEAGLRGARQLNSEKRLDDSAALHRRLSMVWPDEPKVRDLAAQLHE